MSLSFTDSPTSLSNYLDCKQRGVTGAKRGAIKWAISRELVLPEGECVINDHDPVHAVWGLSCTNNKKHVQSITVDRVFNA